MSTKFTPGPWVIPIEQWDDDSPDNLLRSIRIAEIHDHDCDLAYVAYRADDGDNSAQVANAHLIAAAPMLYEAMDRILNAETATQYGVDNDNRSARYKELAMALQDGRAALKAARGES